MRMAAQVEALVGFDTYPHVDCYERGLEAIKLMHSPNLFSYDLMLRSFCHACESRHPEYPSVVRASVCSAQPRSDSTKHTEACPRESGGPHRARNWIPAFAGMT